LRVSPERRATLLSELTASNYYLPAIEKRYARRAVNASFVFGRQAAQRQFIRPHYHLTGQGRGWHADSENPHVAGAKAAGSWGDKAVVTRDDNDGEPRIRVAIPGVGAIEISGDQAPYAFDGDPMLSGDPDPPPDLSHIPAHEWKPDTTFLAVRRIDVEPEFRRQGVATALYQRAMKEAVKAGFSGLASKHKNRAPAATSAWMKSASGGEKVSADKKWLYLEQGTALSYREKLAFLLKWKFDDEDGPTWTGGKAGPNRDESGHFISDVDAVNGGGLTVDAVIQTAVMDTATCDPCAEVDGEQMDLGDDRQLELHPPYVKCLGGDACRCVQIALLSNGREINVDEIDEDTIE
jgi:GNAT superfamily N-acetyltransferase